MLQLSVKQNLMVYDDPEKVAGIEKEITGVAVSHERGMEEMAIKFMNGQEDLGELKMDLKTVRMMVQAFGCMKILDVSSEQERKKHEPTPN